MHKYTAIEVQHVDFTFYITLNRVDKLNSLNSKIVEELHESFSSVNNSKTRLIVFQANGTAFSGGFDLSGLDQQSDADLAYRFLRIESFLQEVANSPVYTVAMAQGPIIGAGADLFAACDVRVVDPGAKFRFPGLKFGVVLGTRRLQSRIGSDAARSLLQSAEIMKSQDALKSGLATLVSPKEEWSTVLQEVQERSKALSQMASGDLSRALSPGSADADFADLARSVTRPGLRDRISSYLRAEGS